MKNAYTFPKVKRNLNLTVDENHVEFVEPEPHDLLWSISTCLRDMLVAVHFLPKESIVKIDYHQNPIHNDQNTL